MSSLDAFADAYLAWAVKASLGILSISFLIIVYRIVKGPSLPDRVVALDMLVAVGIGFIAAVGLLTGYYLYIDIAITLGLVGFLATVAFARFILNRGAAGDATIMDEVKDSIRRREGRPMSAVVTILAGTMLVIGALFALGASIGIVRLKMFICARMRLQKLERLAQVSCSLL
ncbi:Multisubunit Na+/H+ antiporter, MnhF subunit [Roseibium alexandrii DFL-11]|uniref:Multisubunit Na+/H+ antiporter, MnhF subunit n=1 Tax=Roseibium alexandrii (strain DSM 17067 / NCIMB 14079 / DFL-11) TaxID=244592 RepID=A0A5E8H4Q8_ROSAD|nr:Multisubunit Na+/H+ antiporter, MnhF subunit [Roseibium alexandrii DFL-11]